MTNNATVAIMATINLKKYILIDGTSYGNYDTTPTTLYNTSVAAFGVGCLGSINVLVFPNDIIEMKLSNVTNKVTCYYVVT